MGADCLGYDTRAKRVAIAQEYRSTESENSVFRPNRLNTIRLQGTESLIALVAKGPVFTAQPIHRSFLSGVGDEKAKVLQLGVVDREVAVVNDSGCKCVTIRARHPYTSDLELGPVAIQVS